MPMFVFVLENEKQSNHSVLTARCREGILGDLLPVPSVLHSRRESEASGEVHSIVSLSSAATFRFLLIR